MTQVKGNFLEQAVNKFIELVLARLVDAEHLQVKIKANLKDLLAGKLDALTIQMFGFLLRSHLRITEFQFQIGASAVNLQSIRHRKIELLYPAEGSIRMVITQAQLTTFLNQKLGYLFRENQQEFKLEQVKCEFREDGAIAFHFYWMNPKLNNSEICIILCQIETSNNPVTLIPDSFKAHELPNEVVKTALTQVSDILSLNDLANQGSTFGNKQFNMEGGTIIVQAHAYIEQFPSN